MDGRAALLAALSGVLVAAGVYVATHQPSAGQVAAQEIAKGMADAAAISSDAEAAVDERLSGDANEAGYRWAEQRGLTMSADCPAYSAAFRDGCVEYVRDQSTPPNGSTR